MASGAVETYYENGKWISRWQDDAQPFATGGIRRLQVARGAQVACWNRVDHIIRNPDGTIAEHNTYRGSRGEP
jgi:hypothetical protein